jgi:cobalt/nickel transport system permease protein
MPDFYCRPRQMQASCAMELRDLLGRPTGEASAAARAFDPRWKLAAAVVCVGLVLTLRHPGPAFLALAGSLALATIAGLPHRLLRTRLGIVAAALAFFVVPLPLLLRGAGPAWEVGPVTVSAHGLRAALLILCKGLAVATLLLTALATTPAGATLKAAHALRVPGLLVQLGVLTYRYAFVLGDELARLRVALRVRGFRNRPTRHGYRTVGHVAGTLLVRGHDRAERVGQAMRCRGFDGRFRSLAEFRTRPADVALFVALAAGAAALAGWDRLPG